jgi:hypothetical protein
VGAENAVSGIRSGADVIKALAPSLTRSTSKINYLVVAACRATSHPSRNAIF